MNKNVEYNTTGTAPDVDSLDIKTINIKQLNEDVEWLRTDTSMLMEKVFRMEDNDRVEREEKAERDYEISRLKQQVEQLNSMFNNCFSKLCDVQNYVNEMSKNYVDEYTTVKIE